MPSSIQRNDIFLYDIATLAPYRLELTSLIQIMPPLLKIIPPEEDAQSVCRAAQHKVCLLVITRVDLAMASLY